MASIHRKEGTKNWYCCYSLPNGKRVYCSTGKAIRAKAMQRACEIEAEALAKVADAADNQHRMVEQPQEASALAKRGDLSMDRAREIIAQLVATSTGKEMRFHSVRQWGDGWLAGKRCSTAKSSLLTYSRCMTGFLALSSPTPSVKLRRSEARTDRGTQLSMDLEPLDGFIAIFDPQK